MKEMTIPKAFIDQTLYNIQTMMQKFLDGKQDITAIYQPNSENVDIEYTIRGLDGTITVKETAKTEKEIKELIMPYGEITKKLIIEYVRRNLNKIYEERKNDA